MSYALSATVRQPFGPTLAAAREALAEQGFGAVSYTHLTLPTKA